ncbi:lipopolysaccharide-induced tumor necrosis factor-alpha factor homolog [Pseudomyrmex gracilis]|uniref:lipopolysaccharide-induced tumor necrosis factor-alpha factor homolog n=1 Tax=Pseudomyrmex gracilis TaxID=219809 RepID=UPI0009954CB2|nr:lipopolysaccharide-induced tumor necrosis factor-alpha factor homolog [Pseudomyrmex gracilis]
MEKPNFEGPNVQPTAPLPTAPPSYEEAIANAGPPVHPPVGPAPYPIGLPPVQMPIPYNQSANQTVISAPVYPSSSQSAQSQPHFNADPNSVPHPEVRVIHQHLTYTLGPHAVKMTCPSCHVDIKTSTISDHKLCAHICCFLMCIFGCFLCSCLPYCMTACMTTHHFCPNCKNYIGTWKN